MEHKHVLTFSSRAAFSALTWVRLLMSVFPCWHSVWRLLTSSFSFFSSRSPICNAFKKTCWVFFHLEMFYFCHFCDCIEILYLQDKILDKGTSLSFLRAACAALRSASSCFLQSCSSVRRASRRASLSWLLSLRCCRTYMMTHSVFRKEQTERVCLL